jgi:glycosyltransferase involved in cell wall biosynthesis
MPDRVLIVVPCYNQAHYLPENIATIAAQTSNNFECVIVDDGSPDNTAEVAEQLIAQYPDRDIRLLRQKNAGLSEARNAGIRSSDAPLILPLDSDDKLFPEAVQKLAAAFDADPRPSLVSPWGRRFGDKHHAVVAYESDLPWLLKRNTYVTASMFTREAFEKVGGYKRNMAGGYEDWELWISILEAGGIARVVEEELYYYRKAGESMLDQAVAMDLWLRAQIVLNHPTLFERGRRWLARHTRKVKDPQNPGLITRLGWLYYFVRDRNRTAFRQQLRAMFSKA